MSKVCENCKWCLKEQIRYGWECWCCRYPEWVEIKGGTQFHYCGEFKERDGE